MAKSETEIYCSYTKCDYAARNTTDEEGSLITSEEVVLIEGRSGVYHNPYCAKMANAQRAFDEGQISVANLVLVNRNEALRIKSLEQITSEK